MTQLLDIPEKEIKITPNAICGDCLHARDSHEKHNGHFMYCSACMKLCDLDEYLKVHKPSKIVINTVGLDKYRIDLNGQ